MGVFSTTIHVASPLIILTTRGSSLFGKSHLSSPLLPTTSSMDFTSSKVPVNIDLVDSRSYQVGNFPYKGVTFSPQIFGACVSQIFSSSSHDLASSSAGQVKGVSLISNHCITTSHGSSQNSYALRSKGILSQVGDHIKEVSHTILRHKSSIQHAQSKATIEIMHERQLSIVRDIRGHNPSSRAIP
jgi:hypothetical protein